MLSIPRQIDITINSIIIYGWLEVTIINFNEIKAVEYINKIPYYTVPILGAVGFGGYYGYWINIKTRSLCKIYVTQRKACLCIKRYNDIDIIIDDIDSIVVTDD